MVNHTLGIGETILCIQGKSEMMGSRKMVRGLSSDSVSGWASWRQMALKCQSIKISMSGIGLGM